MNDNSAEIRQKRFSVEEPDSASSDSITFMSAFLAVLKRPWIMVLSLLIVIVPLLFYLQSIRTVYKSSANVMISVRESTLLDAVSLVEGTGSDVKSVDYYTSILESSAFHDSVAKHIIRLYPHLQRDSVARVARKSTSYSTNRRKPGFIQIYATSESKEFALILARTALEKFQTRSVNLQREDALHISEFIYSQIENISNKLESAEEALQSFVTSKELMTIGDESGITKELFDLELKHNEAKANLEMVNINISSYNQQVSELLDMLSDGSEDIDESRVSTLKNRLAEIRRTLDNSESLKLNQANIQILEAERNQIRDDLINLVTPATDKNNGALHVSVTIQKLEEALEGALLLQTGYRNQVRFYELQINRFRREHPNLSEDILKSANLSRAKEVLHKTLDILLEKREEVRIRVESEMGGIKVIDAPRMPGQPMVRNRLKNMFLGILSAIALGVVLSIIFDRFDNTIKDENDIQSFGLSVFGTIPSLDDAKHGGLRYDKYSRKRDEDYETANNLSDRSRNFNKNLLKHYSEKSPIAEAYRSLKINLQFIATDKSKKVFVISSPSASEGKSLTTSNLGISFARGGNRTLIIDCDLRRSVQHKYFEIDRKPGLTNHLYGDVELDDIIHDIDVDNLSLITAGSSPSNPAGLLASAKMRNLLNELRSQYDYILIDSPPILVCSDSRIIGEVVDGMIGIVKVESTNAKALEHSIKMTNHLNIEIAGIILNQVEFRFGRAYYYTYRYYKPYSYYGGYYYKREYYDYTESETGEKTKRVKSQGKGMRKKQSHTKQV